MVWFAQKPESRVCCACGRIKEPTTIGVSLFLMSALALSTTR